VENYSAQEVSSRTLHERASLNPADVYGTNPYETREMRELNQTKTAPMRDTRNANRCSN